MWAVRGFGAAGKALVVTAVVAAAGTSVALAIGGQPSIRPVRAGTSRQPTTTWGSTATTAAPALRPSTPPPPAPTVTTTTTTSVARASAPAASGGVTLAGCPPPPHAPVPSPPPWHPAVLVPDSSLPAVSRPAPWHADLAPLAGTGMWIWQWQSTSGGNPSAVVAQARAAHLNQLWVRVGDSMNGFYGAAELDQLVPVAHSAGMSVIAWGFPYLYDPVGDARWTAQILAWRGPGGQAVDGYSADVERSSEGVDLTGQRAAVYLQAVRAAAGSRPVVATVYPPTDDNWQRGGYPYAAMAPYVDAFAPMIYWECTDPGADAALDVSRLATLRPVHIIGQAFDLAAVGGRAVPPSGAEITDFLRAGQRAGALGASFWVWQEASPEEWAAITSYRW
jgi:hypothetical protein